MWLWITIAIIILGFLAFLWAILGAAKKADQQVNQAYRRSRKEREQITTNEDK